MTDARCTSACAGARRIAIGGTLLLAGRGLAETTGVRFPAAGEEVTAAPLRTTARRVEVVVPDGATSGKPRTIDADGGEYSTPRVVRVVAATALPRAGSFQLARATVRPRRAFVDARRQPRLRYRFRAYGRTDVRLELLRREASRRGRTRVLRSWVERARAPFAPHARSWNGLLKRGRAAPGGRYRFRVMPVAGRTRGTAAFRLYDHRFPLPGRHRYGDRFGVPRSGGRTHEGQDLWAGCGARVLAARGGRVTARGYSGALYGHYVTIDGRGIERDYFYSHLLPNVRVGEGDRVRSGELIGSVGATGNARAEGCQLHFELWGGGGWRRGRPLDPWRLLRRWDRWS